MSFVNADFSFREFRPDEIAAVTSAVRNAKSDRYARLAYNALVARYTSEDVGRTLISILQIGRSLSKQHQIVWC